MWHVAQMVMWHQLNTHDYLLASTLEFCYPSLFSLIIFSLFFLFILFCVRPPLGAWALNGHLVELRPSMVISSRLKPAAASSVPSVELEQHGTRRTRPSPCSLLLHPTLAIKLPVAFPSSYCHWGSSSMRQLSGAWAWWGCRQDI